MEEVFVESVFKKSGIPTFTFVKPDEFTGALVSIRTPGRGLVIEGPSGIGKTTLIKKALEELKLYDKTVFLSPRRSDDLEYIKEISTMNDFGVVVIDDFHKLDLSAQEAIANKLKILADDESINSKLIIVGINNAGDSLIRFASDLNNRIDTIKLEKNPDNLVSDLIDLGSNVLGINIGIKEEIVNNSFGSFHIAQLLCHETCIKSGIVSSNSTIKETTVSFETIRSKILEDLHRLFFDKARHFATGPRLRKEGRAPYLHLLKWLSECDEWALKIADVLAKHQTHRNSINQIVDGKYLHDFVTNNENHFSDILHYNQETKILSVEDPKFVFFIKNLSWKKFSRDVGYVSADFESKYDFALSFAGADRDIAEKFFELLSEEQFEVFYDKNEQHRILANNVEDYLAPIYKSEADYVIVILGPDYPKKIWTKFESQQFGDRFGENSVIPIWLTPPSAFDATAKVGGIHMERNAKLTEQINEAALVLKKKINEVNSHIPQ